MQNSYAQPLHQPQHQNQQQQSEASGSGSGSGSYRPASSSSSTTQSTPHQRGPFVGGQTPSVSRPASPPAGSSTSGTGSAAGFRSSGGLTSLATTSGAQATTSGAEPTASASSGNYRKGGTKRIAGAFGVGVGVGDELREKQEEEQEGDEQYPLDEGDGEQHELLHHASSSAGGRAANNDGTNVTWRSLLPSSSGGVSGGFGSTRFPTIRSHRSKDGGLVLTLFTPSIGGSSSGKYRAASGATSAAAAAAGGAGGGGAGRRAAAQVKMPSIVVVVASMLARRWKSLLFLGTCIFLTIVGLNGAMDSEWREITYYR